MFQFSRLWRFGSHGKMDIQSAYKVLGIQQGSALQEVKSSYLKLAKEHHPDLNNGDDSKMKAVNVAYETIVEHVKLTMRETKQKSSTGEPATNQMSYAEKYGLNKNKNASTSFVSDHEAWTTRSEFDWAAAVQSVSEAEAADAKNHPDSHNKHFSWEDDLTIFKEIRSGASVAQVGRMLGKSPLAIERRISNAQFKQRAQRILKTENIKVRRTGEFLYESTDPLQRTAVRNSRQHQVDWNDNLGFNEEDDASRSRAANNWTADRVMSPMGRSYANYRKYHQQSTRRRTL
jgi:curved DNA-binding protein CbpA